MDIVKDLGDSCQMPDPKIPKSGHFCLHGFSQILSAPRIRPHFCTNFVCTLDQAFQDRQYSKIFTVWPLQTSAMATCKL